MSSKSGGDGPVDVGDELAAMTNAGSWYAPSSVEARLGRKRNKQPGVGRTQPPLTEEDIRLAAGMPGFADVDRSSAAMEAAAQRGETPATPPPPPPKKKIPGWVAMMEDAMGSSGSTCVRISQAKVARSSLLSFLQTYKLLVLPALAARPECLSAKLLVSRKSDQERQRESDEALEEANAAASRSVGSEGGNTILPQAGGQGPDTITVTAVTEWVTQDGLEQAAQDPAYAAAIRQLATYMRGSPISMDTNQAAGMDKRTGSGISSEALAEPQPGPALGLR